jgi:rod shape-determining protein MreD
VRVGLIAIAALMVVAHLILHVGLGLGAGAPDLATLGLLVLAREVRMTPAATTGFVVGLLEDALSVLSFGANTVALTVVGALGARTRDLFVGDSVTFVVSYFAVGKWLRDLIQWLMTSGDLREPFARAVLVDSTVASLYVAALGVLLFAAVGLLGGPGHRR